MAVIRVPDIWQTTVTNPGASAPGTIGTNFIEYEVSDLQAQRWSNLTQEQQIEPVRQASKGKKDLRDCLETLQ